MLPIVAVVGRPNVGKSTLVNRIVGGRPAVTEEMPGVTRDRREFRAEWIGHEFLVVDTGGWELKPGEPIVSEIRQQAEAALATADVILYVTDATAGVSDDDAAAAGAAALGGEVLLGPDPELRNGTIALVVDPMGAVLALQQWTQ